MLPTWALRAMGIDDPQIGMNISLSYQLGTDYQYISEEFVCRAITQSIRLHVQATVVPLMFRSFLQHKQGFPLIVCLPQ